MNCYKKKILFPALLFLLSHSLKAQTKSEYNYPEIGKECPNFILNNINYYSKKLVTLKDFKGKWLILDFWTKWCIPCIKSFPETNKLQRQFKDRVQFLLIGRDDPGVRDLYQKMRGKYDLQLPIAFDRRIFNRFGVESVPHVVWIDKNGIVRAITTSLEVNQENIQSFLDGESVKLKLKLNKKQEEEKERSFDFNKPFLINDNGGNDTSFLYRSILTNWDPNLTILYPLDFSPISKPNELLITGAPLGWLYQLAYGDTIFRVPLSNPNSYGRFWTKPILETRDSSLFKYNHNPENLGQNIYCYSLTVPLNKANKQYLQKTMQRDLQNYFGFGVTVESRMMPCWKLTIIADTILKAKNRKENIKGIPISDLIASLWGYNQNEPPFINETGIAGDIYLDIEKIIFSDFADVKANLEKNGLKLIKGEKEMRVIVIHDPKN